MSIRRWFLAPVLDDLRAVQLFLQSLNRKVNSIMSTASDLRDAVASIKTAVEAFPAAVDAAEKRLTDAIAAGASNAELEAAAQEAIAGLRGASDTATGAVADLSDGKDEADAPVEPPVVTEPPVEPTA